MNGFEQIKSFYSWVFNNSDKVRPTHISLYLFLLNQNNRCMWVEWFKCPYDLAMQGACIGNKNTYYKALDELQLYGLIFYKKGINLHKAPMIKLVQLYDNVPLNGNVTVPLCEPLTAPVSEPLSVLLNKNTYKLITDNYKLVNNNIEGWLKLETKEILQIPENLKPIWDLWLEYRKAKKIKNYAGAKFEQMAIDKLIKFSDGNPITAKKIIEESITNSWTGFFELKNLNNNQIKDQNNETVRQMSAAVRNHNPSIKY